VPPERRFPDGLLERMHHRPDLWENVARLAADDLFAQGRLNELWSLLVAMGRLYLQNGSATPASMLALEIGERHRLFEPKEMSLIPTTIHSTCCGAWRRKH
jgi:hypothetical protein